MHKVYAKIDEHGGIHEIGSDVFLTPLELESPEWVQIDEGDGDRYVHAQGNYLPGRTLDDEDNPRYALITPGDGGSDYIIKIADDDEP